MLIRIQEPPECVSRYETLVLNVRESRKLFAKTIQGTKIFRENFRENENFRINFCEN
jgi:hypothetical protein